METTEPDKRVSPGNQVMEQVVIGAKCEPLTQDTFLKQDGNLQDGCRVVSTERYNGMLPSRQLCSRSNMTSMDTSAKELLSSISASPVTLSGLYCTGAEASMKDIPPSFRSNSPMLSGLYCPEGAVKDYSAFAVSNKASAGPGVLNSHVNEIKIPGLNSTSSHMQRPWLPQKPQNHQLKSVDKEAASQASIRVARPPGEGRGKNQLLPRYWPRITDQELQLLTTKEYPTELLLFPHIHDTTEFLSLISTRRNYFNHLHTIFKLKCKVSAEKVDVEILQNNVSFILNKETVQTPPLHHCLRRF